MQVSKQFDTFNELLGHGMELTADVQYEEFLKKINWTPLKSNLNTWDNFEIYESSPSKIILKPKSNIFKINILLWGLFSISFVSTILLYLSNKPDAAITTLMLAVLFLGFKVLYRQKYCKTISFDKRTNLFYQGKRPPYKGNKLNPDNICKLDNIYALQLIRKELKRSFSQNDKYSQFELNIVLKNRERLHVLTTNDSYLLRLTAKQLGSFLNIYVWDRI